MAKQITVERKFHNHVDYFGFTKGRYSTICTYDNEQVLTKVISDSIVDDIDGALKEVNGRIITNNEDPVSLDVKVTNATLTNGAKTAIKNKFESEPSFNTITFKGAN